MPTSTIPYDPSLVLGMIVEPKKIQTLEKIADAQKDVDAQRDYVNALLRQKLSLDMTGRELISLGVDPASDELKSFNENITELNKEILQASVDLGGKVIAAEKEIVGIKSDSEQQQIGTQLQSPIDFSASQLKSMPLSSDSMDMDVQYFRYEDQKQSSSQKASSVSAFVGAKVSRFLGPTIGAQVSNTSQKSSVATHDAHKIIGTLVICANCTSREAQIFSPVQLDVDAAVESYSFYKDGNNMPTETMEEMKTIATKPIKKDDQKNALPVLIGASYGSSFVGFVHFEKIEKTDTAQSAQSKATQARAEVEANLFLASIEGSFGLDAQTSSSVKALMSSSDIQSHCSVIAMGLIPSIKSNNVKSVVKSMKNDPAENMAQLAAMQTSANTATKSMAASGAEAKKGQSIEQMNADYIKAAVSAVSEVDSQDNKVIDLNSMMTALDDYVAKAGDGKTGVPINFYLKYVTARDIAIAWMNKYHPGELFSKKPDDDGEASGD